MGATPAAPPQALVTNMSHRVASDREGTIQTHRSEPRRSQAESEFGEDCVEWALRKKVVAALFKPVRQGSLFSSRLGAAP